ncbi:hypothetical protein FLAVO9AF_70032 [Flavobacterium sp. 9AF]|nr:hypothetical protein FLAVO9AF_70032 [Flavobacterium sp. 9AF]
MSKTTLQIKDRDIFSKRITKLNPNKKSKINSNCILPKSHTLKNQCWLDTKGNTFSNKIRPENT